MLVATLVGVGAPVLVDVALALPYLEVSNEFGPRPPAEVAFYSTGPLAFLVAPQENLLWAGATAGARSQLVWFWEETLFPGVAIIGLILVGLFAGGYPR
jgi:hypothetical protein